MKHSSILLSFLLLLSIPTYALVYSDKVVGKMNEAAIDSLKKSEYPYHLPIWGEKATAAGYKLPYCAGLGINYLWQKSDLVIENLNVGFNGGTMYNLYEIVRFNTAVSEASVVNIRPDIWILPFLNIYGILATSKPSTNVGFGIWVPDSSNNWKEVLSYNTKVNFTWTDVSALDKPAFTFVFGPRLGKSFNLKKPDQNIAIWVGGFRVQFASATQGSIALSDVISEGGNAGSKIDAGQEKVAQTQVEVDAWWNGLSDAEQNNPVNIAKNETANKALTAAGNILNAAEGALSTISGSTVQYSLAKRVKDKWNFVVGSQFQ